MPLTTIAHTKSNHFAGDKHSRNDTLHQHGSYHGGVRPGEKASASRAAQRARKLQLSDVDW